MRRLKPEELRTTCDPATLPFASTAELAPIDGMIGQERAMAATTFGIAIRRKGYNLFVLGPTATGKTTTMRRVLALQAAGEPTPSDYCYVHNFADPYRPSALELPAGRGRELREAMRRLAEECRGRLPQVFESEEFLRQKGEIVERFESRQRAAIEEAGEVARREGFAIMQTPRGLALAPAPEGRPLGPDEFMALPEEKRTQLTASIPRAS